MSSKWEEFVLKGCLDALKVNSDNERANRIAQIIFVAKLNSAPKKVIAKLKVAAGSTGRKRKIHLEETIRFISKMWSPKEQMRIVPKGEAENPAPSDVRGESVCLPASAPVNDQGHITAGE